MVLSNFLIKVKEQLYGFFAAIKVKIKCQSKNISEEAESITSRFDLFLQKVKKLVISFLYPSLNECDNAESSEKCNTDNTSQSTDEETSPPLEKKQKRKINKTLLTIIIIATCPIWISILLICFLLFVVSYILAFSGIITAVIIIAKGCLIFSYAIALFPEAPFVSLSNFGLSFLLFSIGLLLMQVGGWLVTKSVPKVSKAFRILFGKKSKNNKKGDTL